MNLRTGQALLHIQQEVFASLLQLAKGVGSLAGEPVLYVGRLLLQHGLLPLEALAKVLLLSLEGLLATLQGPVVTLCGYARHTLV